jgi:hypothetical protein
MKLKLNDFTWSWSQYIANIFGFKNKELTLKFKLNKTVIIIKKYSFFRYSIILVNYSKKI